LGGQMYFCAVATSSGDGRVAGRLLSAILATGGGDEGEGAGVLVG
jgi:hypothetical protein